MGEKNDGGGRSKAGGGGKEREGREKVMMTCCTSSRARLTEQTRRNYKGQGQGVGIEEQERGKEGSWDWTGRQDERNREQEIRPDRAGAQGWRVKLGRLEEDAENGRRNTRAGDQGCRTVAKQPG